MPPSLRRGGSRSADSRRDSLTEFVITWQTSGSAEQVAVRLLMPLDTVLSWAWHLRDVGVPLRVLPRRDARTTRLVAQVVRMVSRRRSGAGNRLPAG